MEWNACCLANIFFLVSVFPNIVVAVLFLRFPLYGLKELFLLDNRRNKKQKQKTKKTKQMKRRKQPKERNVYDGDIFYFVMLLFLFNFFFLFYICCCCYTHVMIDGFSLTVCPVKHFRYFRSLLYMLYKEQQ